MTNNTERYGFTAVPRDPDVLFLHHSTAGGSNPTQASYKLSEIPFPDSELVRQCKAFVAKELNVPTFNHSHRVFIYGKCISCYDMYPMTCCSIGTALAHTHFPDWKYDDEVYYLSCLFHDIGTADRYLATTKMSFEFKGAIVAREFIMEHGGNEDLADAVCEVSSTLQMGDLWLYQVAGCYSPPGCLC